MVYPIRGIVQGFRRLGAHPQRLTVAYVSALVSAALITAFSLFVADYGLGSALTVVTLAVAAAAAERTSVRLSRSNELSISVLPTIFAAVLFGPLAAGVVGAASMLGDPELISRRNPDRAPRLKWATYSSTRFMGGAVAGLTAQATITLVPTEFGGLIAATLVATLVCEILEVAFAVLTTAVRGGSAPDTARMGIATLLLAPPVYAPLTALLAFMYVEVSPWTLALFLVPAMAAQRLYALYQEQRRLAGDL